ncbi:MAG TPA: nucleotidyltransferase domain-containing protein [Phycisphaerales bacterium]|nr:nucleotidyltransferase domain-containing protein [Phycisphaerales bacterium]
MVPLIRDNLDKIAELCRRHGVRRLFLIGSALGEGFDPERSDVDFLVEFEPHESKGFDDVYFLLLADLKALLGREVDLIERHCIRNPVVRHSIEHSKVPLYAAA